MTLMVKALIVDDSEADRELIKRALARGGEEFAIREAATREEMEAWLRAERFDVVITDYDIAGFTGLEVLDAVQAVQPEAPVILVTGTGSEEIAVSALKKGAADYVVKSTGHIQRLPSLIAAVVERVALAREREALQDDLRRSEEKYRALVETAREAILGVAGDTYVTVFSGAAEKMFGYAAAEVIGRPFGILAPAHEADIRGWLGQAATGDADGGFRTLNMTRCDGSSFPGELSLSAFAANGLGYTAVIRDVSAKRRLEREVARLDRLAAVGEMVTGIAHEVRNPLAAIATSAAVVKTDLASAGLDAEGADWIMAGVEKIEGLLERFFDFARPLEVRRQRCDLAALLRDVLGEDAFQLERAGVRVTWAIRPDLPAVDADADLLRVVVTNVVKNAREAMREGGELAVKVDLGADQGQDFVRVAFTDSGVGITPEAAQRLLEPFFTTKTQGVGLGLPLCYKIIKAHGGEFAIVGLEVGAEIAFTLPVGDW